MTDKMRSYVKGLLLGLCGKPLPFSTEQKEQWETVLEMSFSNETNEPLTGGGQYNGYTHYGGSPNVGGSWLYNVGDTVRLTVNGVSTIHTVPSGRHIGNTWLGKETTESEFSDNGFDFYMRHTVAPLIGSTTYHVKFFSRDPGEYTVKIEKMITQE